MNTPQQPSRNVFLLIGQTIQLLSGQINKELRRKSIDLNIEQFSIMAILWYNEGISQQEIASFLRKDKTTITRVLDTMYRKDLLVRVTDNDDRRIKRIYLTNKGKELQDASVKAIGNVYMKGLQGIDGNEESMLIQSITRIIRNLE